MDDKSFKKYVENTFEAQRLFNYAMVESKSRAEDIYLNKINKLYEEQIKRNKKLNSKIAASLGLVVSIMFISQSAIINNQSCEIKELKSTKGE